MDISVKLEQSPKWDAFWFGLAAVGDLGNREVEIIADTARRGVARNFEQERAPDGTPWQPLAPMTQQIRGEGIDERGIPFRTGTAHPILVRTTDLKQSFINPRHSRNITDVSRSAGVVSVLLSAADDPETPGRIAMLHSGGSFLTARAGAELVERDVPARPFIGLSDQALAQVDEQARRILAQRVDRL